MAILIAGIALAALIVAAVVIRGVWPFEPAAGTLTQLALAAVALAIASLFLGAFVGFALLAAAAGLALWRTRDALAPPSAPVAEPHSKAVWANLFMKEASLKAAQRLALAEAADITAFAELPANADLLPEFAHAFPHRFPAEPAEGQDNVIFGRRPFLSASMISAWRRPSLIVETMIGDRPMTIAAVHAPVPWTPAKLALQRRLIAEAFAAAEARATFLIVGDFNAAPWSDVLKTPAAIRRLNLGARATWVSPLPLIGIPIDHAFVSHDLDGSVALGAANGSDHRPIIVSVRRKT